MLDMFDLFDAPFERETDVFADAYLARLLDILEIPEDNFIRKSCCNCISKYLRSEQAVDVTVKELLILSDAFKQDPGKFKQEHIDDIKEKE